MIINWTALNQTKCQERCNIYDYKNSRQSIALKIECEGDAIWVLYGPLYVFTPSALGPVYQPRVIKFFTTFKLLPGLIQIRYKRHQRLFLMKKLMRRLIKQTKLKYDGIECYNGIAVKKWKKWRLKKSLRYNKLWRKRTKNSSSFNNEQDLYECNFIFKLPNMTMGWSKKRLRLKRKHFRQVLKERGVRFAKKTIKSKKRKLGPRKKKDIVFTFEGNRQKKIEVKETLVKLMNS